MTSPQSPIFSAGRSISRIILPICFQVRLQGLELLPKTGPAVLIPKHQQWWDVPLLGTYIPRRLCFLAKQELFNTAFSRFFIYRFGGIPINRKQPLKSLETFRSLFPLLQENKFLVLFPEGTYFKNKMGPGKWRLIQIILRLQQKHPLPPIAFLPIGIRYSTKSEEKRKSVEISIGPSLFETDPNRAEAFTQDLLAKVKILSRL